MATKATSTERSGGDDGRSPRPVPGGLLLLALVVHAFALLGARGLWEPDEGRYVAVSLQMLESGDWLHPRLHHELPHYTKPPLTYWMVAASMAVWGRGEFGARFPLAVMFVLTALALYRCGRIFTPRSPWLPALVYATLPLAYGAASILTTDAILTAFETWAVAMFVTRRFGRGGRAAVVWMWTFLGLAFLTKGPPGLLPLLAILVFTWLDRDRVPLRALLPPVGLLSFAVLGLGWYLVLLATTPGLLDYWWRHEIVGRVLGEHHRNDQWYGMFTVYVPALLLGCLPWVALLLRPRALRRGIRRALGGRRPASRFLFLWFTVPLVVFSISRSRLPLYVLPITAPLALAAARRARTLRPRRARTLGVATAILLVGIRGALAAYSTPERDSRRFAAWLGERISFDPAELVVVDHRPFFGAAMYLDCEVEPLQLENRRRSRSRYAHALDREFAEKDEGPRIFVVDRRKAARLVAAARAAGDELDHLGRYVDLDVFAEKRRRPR